MITFSLVPSTSTLRLAKIKEFLALFELECSEDVESFVVAKEDAKIIACGGIAGKVLKDIAIDGLYQGKHLALKLMSELLHVAYEAGRQELFLFTKPCYVEVFEDCGFKYITQAAKTIALMENHQNLEPYCKSLRALRVKGNKIGSLVVNCNPFTLGHLHLVKSACATCDWVHLFVVKEDASYFPYVTRLALIREGLEGIKNLTIHEGSDYIISKATFPTYFIKDKRKIDSLFTELDLNLFRNHLAPQLGITHRFVGEEPLCVVTHEYNQQMKKCLAQVGVMPSIEVVEIKRIYHANEPISASRVRKAMQDGDIELISHLVPSSTLYAIQNILKKQEK